MGSANWPVKASVGWETPLAWRAELKRPIQTLGAVSRLALILVDGLHPQTTSTGQTGFLALDDPVIRLRGCRLRLGACRSLLQTTTRPQIIRELCLPGSPTCHLTG